MSPDWTIIPTLLWITLGALALVQLTLLTISGIDLIRRPASAVAGGRKWPWVVLIIALNTFGPILYLLVGRRRDSVRVVEVEGVWDRSAPRPGQHPRG